MPPNPLRGLGLTLLGVAAPLLGSGGELRLAQLRGRIPGDVSLLDLQRAERAFAMWKPGWKAPAGWTPDQVGRGIVEAASLEARLSAGALSSVRFGEEMGRLVRQIDGRPSASPSPRAPSSPPSPLRPPQGAAIRHTGGEGAQSGSGAAGVQERALAQRAQALETARRRLQERQRTALPAGSQPDLVRSVYEASGLRGLGVGLEDFRAHAGAAGGDPVRRDGRALGGPEAAATARAARFHMPYAYEPDPAWARIMQDAVDDAVTRLGADPSRPLQQVIETMIAFAKPRLLERAGDDRLASIHARLFGVPREAVRVLDFGPSSRLHGYRPLAIEQLQAAGDVLGKPYALLRYAYPASPDPIRLGWLTGEWSSRHAAPADNAPWNHLEWTSAPPEVIPHILRAADRVFAQVGQLAREIACGARRRDAPTLDQAVGLSAETYWLLSHAWPYMRGSAGIADLSTKVIFDRLGIEVPPFRTDRYPNIDALLTPVDVFRAGYPSHFQDAFRWQP